MIPYKVTLVSNWLLIHKNYLHQIIFFWYKYLLPYYILNFLSYHDLILYGNELETQLRITQCNNFWYTMVYVSRTTNYLPAENMQMVIVAL